jgi:hypothetical protein
VSKGVHVALAGHDALKVRFHGYPELIAVAGKNGLQVRFFSSNPGDKVLYLLSLAVLGRSHEYQLRPFSVDHAAVEALELVGDYALPPAGLHGRASMSAKRPELGLLSSLRRTPEAVGNRTSLICVNTRDLREGFVISHDRSLSVLLLRTDELKQHIGLRADWSPATLFL